MAPRSLLFAVLAVAFTATFAGRDFYAVLGVSKSADDDTLKSAYRKLAKKYHPDRQQDEEKKAVAQKRFMEVANAYETLSDPEKRRIYDQVGEEGLRGGGGGQPHTGGQTGGFPGHAGGGSSFSFSSSGGGGGGFSDPMRVFEQFFGGGGGGGPGPMGGARGRRGPQQPPPPAPDLYSGAGCSGVVQLTRATFKSRVSRAARGSRVWLLEFYSPACSACKRMAPTLCKLAEGLGGAASVGAVDCAAHPAVCEAYGVKGYPTLHVLGPAPAGAGGTEYSGSHSGAALKAAIAAALQPAAAQIAAVSLRLPRPGAEAAAAVAAARAKLDTLIARRCSWPSAASLASIVASAVDGAAVQRVSAGCLLVLSDKESPSLTEAALVGDDAIAAAGVANVSLPQGISLSIALHPAVVHVQVIGGQRRGADSDEEDDGDSDGGGAVGGGDGGGDALLAGLLGLSHRTPPRLPAAVLVFAGSLQDALDGGRLGVPSSRGGGAQPGARVFAFGDSGIVPFTDGGGAAGSQPALTFRALHRWLVAQLKHAATVTRMHLRDAARRARPPPSD